MGEWPALAVADMNPGNDTDDADGHAAISCATCEACCCRLEVLLRDEDEVPMALTAQDRWGGWVMRRLDDGWCAGLDRNTLRCAIYARRPVACREFEVGEYECVRERLRLVSPDSSGRDAP
jgi:Fe-S-cluster containining protein